MERKNKSNDIYDDYFDINSIEKNDNKQNNNHIDNDNDNDEDYFKNNNIKGKINVNQSAIANQYEMKIGDVNLNNHFYQKKLENLEEQNRDLKEKLKSVSDFYY
jgi:hypothetical protein